MKRKTKSVFPTAKKIIILGGGPNRIGQGIEFDYCCVHASFTLREEGIESIMVNSNPETVSTDYDTSDKLYFEPLTQEDVLHILETGKAQRGDRPVRRPDAPEPGRGRWQRPGRRSSGPRRDSIDRAEDRERFQAVLQKLDLNQPENGTAMTTVERPGEWPPGSVIRWWSGLPMSWAAGPWRSSMTSRRSRSSPTWPRRPRPEHPILIDKFLEDAIEIDVDAISDGRTHDLRDHGAYRRGRDPFRGQRLRPAPYTLSPAQIAPDQGTTPMPWPQNLDVCGLMNIQYAIKDERSVRPGGQPPGLPDHPLCQQGHRHSPGQARHQDHAGADPGGARD